jgi:hypothetical protein
MTTIAENIKKMAVRFCLSLLFVSGSLSLCQAQGVVGGGQISGLDVPGPDPIQSSAPALSGWEWSGAADMEMASDTSAFTVVDYVPSIVVAVTPVTGQTFTPAISPEPSTLGLLLAGSAALFRFGWRKRSN